MESSLTQLVWREGGLYSGDDQGRVTRWSAGLAVQWSKDTYMDISCLAVGGREVCYLGSVRQCEVVVGDLATQYRHQDNTLTVLGSVQGRAPVVVDEKLTVLVCVDREGEHVLIHRRY